MVQLQMAIIAIVLGLVAAAKDLFAAATQGIESALDGSGFIGEFVRSESGRVNPEQGFRVAWAAGVIVAAMVVLGTPPQAAASCGNTSISCTLPGGNAMCLQICTVHRGCNSGYCQPVCENHGLCICS